MGANMVRRLLKGGHECVAYDRSAEAVKASRGQGAKGVELARAISWRRSSAPRAVWIMVPARHRRYASSRELRPLLQTGDMLIDGGNSHYHDDIRRADELAVRRASTTSMSARAAACSASSRAICLMIGGEAERRSARSSRFSRRWRPAERRRAATGGEQSTAAHGLSALRRAWRRALREDGSQRHRVRSHGGLCRRLEHAEARGCGHAQARRADAETAPLDDPELYQYELDIARDRRGVAARQHHFLAPARSDRRGAGAGSDSWSSSAAACPIPAKDVGRCRRRSRSACRRTC